MSGLVFSFCGPAVPWEPDEWPEGNEAIPCCIGSAMRGPSSCSCWEPVYDLEQLPTVPGPLEIQPRACHDCAFLPGSPERSDHRERELLELPTSGSPFWCHQGMRRVVEYRHPDGRVHVAGPGDYRPPQIDGIPYRADGSPGLICAGWAGRAGKDEAQRVVAQRVKAAAAR